MNMTQKELPAILHGTYQRWRDPWDRVSDIALRMILGGHQLVGIWIRPPRPIQTVLGRHRALWSLSWNLLFQSKPSPLLPFERRKRFRREPLFCFPPRPAFDVSGRPRFPAKARPLGARRSPPPPKPRRESLRERAFTLSEGAGGAPVTHGGSRGSEARGEAPSPAAAGCASSAPLRSARSSSGRPRPGAARRPRPPLGERRSSGSRRCWLPGSAAFPGFTDAGTALLLPVTARFPWT